MEAQVPVIVGVGQVANKDSELVMHPVDLLEMAARAALDDAGAGLTAHIGAVLSPPLSVFSTENGGAAVAERLGLAPSGPHIESTYSGAAPLHLLDRACREIAAGHLDAVLVVGGVADASVRRARARGETAPAPPTSMWSQGSGSAAGERRVRRPSREGFTAEGMAGAWMPASFFALVESAIAAAGGHDPAAHRARLGELLTPFTEVAAARPDLAWFPRARSASEIAGVRDDNRMIAEPYTKLMCSFPTVDLGAAVVVTSAAQADRLGVPSARRVHPWALAAAREPRPPSQRADMHRSGALTAAVDRVLHAAGVTADRIAAFDLYSCFPAAVQLAAAAFGLGREDPRPLTVTGGLPYFGGPGASYALHGIAGMVERCRDDPGSIGAVVGLGGMVDDFAVGLLSTEAPSKPFRSDHCPDVAARLDGEAVPARAVAEGTATVEAMTVLHDRDKGPVGAPMIARLPDGARVGAAAATPDLPAALSGTMLVGREVRILTRDDRSYFELP